jgi:hypothetical protein
LNKQYRVLKIMLPSKQCVIESYTILHTVKYETVTIYVCRSHFGPGFESAPNRNVYQVYFLGVKAAGV